MENKKIIDDIKSVLEIEAECILDLLPNIDDSFAGAVKEIAGCKGRVILSGMGKAGHVAKKIAATLSSLGTPSFFVHPAEAVHGDSGMVTKNDIVIFISNSGETQEVLNFTFIVKQIGAKIISITGNPESTLAKNSEIHLCAKIKREADSLNLAPTSSSTLALSLGDAIAATVSKIKGFTPKDFAFYHPGGSLGDRLRDKKF